MAQTLKLKRSAVAGRVPTTSDLQLGELGLNTYDGKLYTRKDNGSVSIVELSGGAGGGASGGGTDKVFYENDQTITTSYTLTASKNAVTAGPVTINSSITVTVPSGSSWVVV